MEPPFKKVKQEPEESEVKLNDLPELPFEKILSYLPLEDLLRSRAVSRRWYKMISGFRPKCLAFSSRPKHFMLEKNRWVSGAFVQNFISSLRFESFFGSFSQRILSKLKQLRICYLDLNDAIVFSQTLNSFGQLEELGLFWFNDPDSDLDSDLDPTIEFELKLPMLKSIHIEILNEIKRLTLDAPKLENVKVWLCNLELIIVHGELVGRLVTDQVDQINVSKLKSLKYLYLGHDDLHTDFTFLSNLEQLEEIHLDKAGDVEEAFQQKQRYGRSNLKIFLSGVLLDGPDDPAIESISEFGSSEYMRYLTGHFSKVANEIPLHFGLQYSAIECLAPLEMDVLNRFTDWGSIKIHGPVQDIDRFLDFLKSFDNIVDLEFRESDQPQELFDRLPDHCNIQRLWIGLQSHQDLNFLFRLKSLIYLEFEFEDRNSVVSYEVKFDHSTQFKISVNYSERKTVSDLDDAIKFIIESATEIEKAN